MKYNLRSYILGENRKGNLASFDSDGTKEVNSDESTADEVIAGV